MNNLPDKIFKIDQKYQAFHIKTACNSVKIDKTRSENESLRSNDL